MVRTQVYLTEEQDRGLKGLAESSGRKQSELIREAVDRLLAEHRPKDWRAALECGTRHVGRPRRPRRALCRHKGRVGGPPQTALWRMSGLLLDTCVLIDYLRNRPSAIDFLHRLTERVAVSVVTTAELYAGVRDGAEETRVDGLLTRVLVRDVDLTIARLAGRFRREYRQGHGVAIPDALIAATAEVHGARLVTRNARHFPMLADVLVPYP